MSTRPTGSYGETLARVDELCRLGARPPVIRELTRFDAEALVARIFRETTGRSPPRGQLPTDHRQYVSTPAQRLQASLIAAVYSRMSRVHPVYCDAVIATYRLYRGVFGANARFGLDRTWHLLRCLRLGKLEQRSCPGCGGSLLEDREPLAAVAPRGAREPRALLAAACPLCDVLRGRPPTGARPALERAPVALPSAAPSSVLARQVGLAEALCRLGARPPVVADLTRLQNRALIGRLYLQCVGQRAPSGLLPSDSRKFVQSRALKLQASVLALAYEGLVRQGLDRAEALLVAHRVYLAVFGERAQFNINRSWCLVQSLRIRELQMVACRWCGSRFIHDAGSLLHRHCCPLCVEIRRCSDDTPRLPRVAGGVTRSLGVAGLGQQLFAVGAGPGLLWGLAAQPKSAP